MYRIAIGDDDLAFLNHAKALIDKCMEEDGLLQGVDYEIDCYSTADELLDAVHSGNHGYHIYFLDVVYGSVNGLELGAELRESQGNFSLVYVSGHREYVFDSFDTRPLNYLLKPPDKAQLAKLLREDYHRRYAGGRIFLHIGGKYVSLAFEDIWAAEAAQHRVLLHLEGEQLIWSGTLSALVPELPGQSFCRCHNSYIINLAHVTELKRYEAKLDNGTAIPVSKRLYKTTIQQYAAFQKRETT